MKKHRFVLVAAVLSLLIFSSCETNDFDEPGRLVPLTVDEDQSLPSIFVNNTQLHSETFGNPDNPMIVVLHGGPGSDYRSLLNCSRFSADGFFVVFYDQRGSGLSKRHKADNYSGQLFIDDLDAVINFYRHKTDQKIILIGHSWGAMLATAYVNQHPDQISGVVLIEPGGFTWKDAKDYIKRERSLGLFEESSNDYLYLDQIMTGNDHNELDYRASLQSAADFSKGNKVGNPEPYPFWRYGAVCNSAMTKYAEAHPFDFTAHLGQFKTKVLFLYSELNESYGKEHAELVSSAYPNVQLVKINGVGHEIPYFGWDNFYTVAVAYLNSFK